jgi:hypothetical protein
VVHLRKEKNIVEKIGKGMFYIMDALILILGFVFLFLYRFPYPLNSLNKPIIIFVFGWVFFEEFFRFLKWLVRLGERIVGRKNGKRKQ